MWQSQTWFAERQNRPNKYQQLPINLCWYLLQAIILFSSLSIMHKIDRNQSGSAIAAPVVARIEIHFHKNPPPSRNPYRVRVLKFYEAKP